VPSAGTGEIRTMRMIDWLSKKVFGEILPDDNMIRWLFATYEWTA
jgi:hypothetical protein